MGRLLTNGIYGKKIKMGFDDMRKRHRDADCKYRSKVQFLYFKIKSLLRKKSPKDSLLDNALGFIQDLENDIYQTSGSDHMEIIRNEFLVLLVQEESIWKKEKDITKWWTKVENMLGNDIQMDLWVECNAYQENFKSKKRGRPRKNTLPQKYVKDECYCINEHMPMLPSCNEVYNEPIEDSSVRRSNGVSSSWIFPEVPDFRPHVAPQNGTNPILEELLSDDSMNSNSNDIFGEILPIEYSTAPVLVDISNKSLVECPKKTQNSFLYL